MKMINIWVTLAGYIAAATILHASPVMVVVQGEELGQGGEALPKVIWSTDPGIRYELQDSSDMESWSTVAGYPSEAEALAQQYELEMGEDAEQRRFFRVQQLDEQPPAIINRIPGANTFGARRDSTISAAVSDLSGVDPNSILMTVDGHGSFSVDSPLLSFSSNVVVCSLGDGIPFGDWGSTQSVSLAVADILGNAAEYQWNFELETEPEIVADLFIFGSEEAQHAGQRLNDMPAKLATWYGRVRLPASPDNDWQIASVSSNTIVLSYVVQAPTSFAVDQLLANRTPASVDEIFYRRINAIEDDPDSRTYTLHTSEVNLSDLVLDASFSIGDDSVLLEFDPEGRLVQIIDFEETFQLPSIGADFTGEVLFTNENYTLLLDEGKFLFHPYLKTSVNVDWEGVNRFEAQAGGNLEVSCVPHLLFQDSYSTNVTHELWRATHWLWGAVGVVPVGVEITATIRVESSLDISAAADIKAGFRQYGNMRVGGRFERNANPQVQMYREFNIPPMEEVPLTYILDGEGQATLALIPQLNVRVYGAAGLYMNVDPRVEISGTATVVDGTLTDDDWLLGAYADVNAGLSVIGFETGELPGISFNLFTWEWAEQYSAAPPASAPTVILRQPVSQTVQAGDTAYFSVNAEGGGSLSYQWYHNGKYIVGGSRRELTLPNVSSAHSGDYYVRVTGEGGTVNSSSAGLLIVTSSSVGLAPSGMVIIPGGINSGVDPNIGAYSLTVDSFYMDKYEVTKALWDEVYNWAITNGYSFDNAGMGKATNHPVHSVSWYDMVKWCNARSERELRPAVYTVDRAVYKVGQSDDVAQSSAAGYRLPTDMEWEYAARGGVTSRRFPWGDSDEIQHERANYNSTKSAPYDTSPTDGYHPTYNDGTKPYTSPVGSFAPNGYGLYDMAGNVNEFYFHLPREWPDQHNRGYCGGSWALQAYYNGVAVRSIFAFAGSADHFNGFRTVLPPTVTRPGYISLAGDFNGWDEAAHNMVHKGDGLWEGDVFLDAFGTEFKFTLDGDWSASWGEANQTSFSIPLSGIAEPGGHPDIVLQGPLCGTYRFKFNVVTYEYSVTLLQAGDCEPPYGMVLIPAGSFMSNGTNVYVDAFSVENFEVTKKMWNEVRYRATYYGYDPYYSFTPFYYGEDDKSPAASTWYSCARWCNVRSMIEGLAPCYDIYTWQCYNTDGYRLPTEAEWEKAARGGEDGHRFPWHDSEHISHARANYCASSYSGNFDVSFDDSWPAGCHPEYDCLPSPVGTFPPNSYGLYDMAGNVSEWVNPVDASRLKGGSCLVPAAECQIWEYQREDPNDYGQRWGFRCVRSAHGSSNGVLMVYGDFDFDDFVVDPYTVFIHEIYFQNGGNEALNYTVYTPEPLPYVFEVHSKDGPSIYGETIHLPPGAIHTNELWFTPSEVTKYTNYLIGIDSDSPEGMNHIFVSGTGIP